MSTENITQTLTQTVEELSEPVSLKGLFHQHRDGNPLPSLHALEEIIELSRSILFPGFYGKSTVNTKTIRYHIGVNMERLHKLLTDQILAGLCFACDNNEEEDYPALSARREQAVGLATRMITRLPHIRKVLATDVEAAYNGDPAAESRDEIILCYPGFYAITVYRMAHELYLMNVPMLPRIMTEYAHTQTGIDINPGATIGKYFFIDHGTGIVIGETTWIGEHVKIYQGVTLGALSTRGGRKLQNKKRHPTIEDNVTIYSGASILGGDTVIGKNSIIGGNVFLTDSVAEDTRVSAVNQELRFDSKNGRSGQESNGGAW